MQTRGYAATSATAPLSPFTFERREPREHDILIEIQYAGICHSDLHTVKNEWGEANFPIVPGHEIAGRVARVGGNVSRFKVGDLAGVGCFVDSCRQCRWCKAGEEQFCEKGASFTYNGTEQDGKTPTQGGYSTQIVVDENYALKITSKLPLERIAPLMCAGITTYSPLHTWKVGKGQKVGVVGLGGLGHMGVKLAASLGAEVSVFSTSASKEGDAKKLGAHHFVLSKDPETLKALAGSFDYILNTVSAEHHLGDYLELLRPDGTLTLVGASPTPFSLSAFALIMKRRRLVGSLIGGIRETQEMLDYCAAKNIAADVEVIPASQINKAYERLVKGDVRYRFVIDAKTF